ncbi:MAG: hypothetical protein RLZZ214_984 [Verrucomicrobiota bacterium]
MGTSTAYNQRRRPGRKAEDIRLVWKEQAPQAVFAEKPLAELEATLAELQQSNEELKIKDQARSAAVKTRDDKLKSLAALLRVVVKGVQCHPAYGEDSPLYRAMGYVTISERKTGLIRRPKAGAGDPAANGEAAV